jgi:probable phosphoglycerate mutase
LSATNRGSEICTSIASQAPNVAGVTTRLVLIRHGQSKATLQRIVGGPKGDTGLSDLGRDQATGLRDRLRRTGELVPDVVAASVLPRAIETAQIVLPDHDLVTDCDWCELHPGECDGLVWDEYMAIYDTGPHDPDRPMSPGGESLRTFDARVRRAIDALLVANADKTTVLFTHGGFITAATYYLLGSDGMFGQTGVFLDPRNTSITEFAWRDDGRWTFERFNDSAHLLG